MLRLSAAELSPDPFPHLILDNALDADLFASTLEAIPTPDRFALKGRGRKLELDLHQSSPELLALPAEHQRRLLAIRDLCRASAPVLAERFADTLAAKYEWLLGADLARDMLAGGWTTTNGRVMGRAPGYQLGPHLDSAHVGATCLLYFTEALTPADGALGLYKPEREPAVLEASTYYPEKSEGIASTLVKTISIRPNRFVAFADTPVSLHGFHRSTDASGWRFVYQCHLLPANLVIDDLIPRLDDARRERWRKYL